MARKDLSRTVIEGGRYYSNCWMRRASHGIERATTRAWLDRVAQDVDEADATLAPARPHVGKAFRDKLAPAYRWLASQIGRPWSRVHAELCARFDTRTLAGRHVVNDHMLQWVRRHDEARRYHSRYHFVIDAHGILRKAPSYWKLRAAVDAWAMGRVCALTYRGWWWFRREGDALRSHATTFVADRAMSRRQVRYLARLPDELRARVVIASPWPAR